MDSKNRALEPGSAIRTIGQSVTLTADTPHQAAQWFPPHRGRANWMAIAPICVHCLQGHRHVVEKTTSKTIEKACPVTGAADELAVPRAVRRG